MIAIFGIFGSKVGIAILSALVGFGGGRVKNSGKLAAVETELHAAETGFTTDVKSLVAKIRAKL